MSRVLELVGSGFREGEVRGEIARLRPSADSLFVYLSLSE